MKVEFYLHLSFINAFNFFSLTFASTSRVFTSDARILKNSSVNSNSVFSPTNLEESLKNSDRSSKQVEDGDSYSLFHEDDKKSSKLKNRFHIPKINPEYLRKPAIAKLNERSNRLNAPTFHHNFNNFLKLFDYKLQNRGPYFEPYYPDLYRRNLFREYGRHTYHPYFRPSYGTPERFMNRRKTLDNFMFGNNQDQFVEKPLLPPETDLFDTDLPVSTGPPSKDYLLATDSDVTENAIDPSQKFQKVASDKSNTEQAILSVATLEPKNKSVVTKDFSRTQNSLGNTTLSNRSLTSTEDEVSDSDYEDLTLSKMDEYESNDISSSTLNDVQESSERSNLVDSFKTENPLTRKRIYYEKVPQNLNLSWFVYVNCSREKCHFTNSTSETELMNEGWVMHNCTSYGCSEMYPRAESIKKFIGLMLLVFSICILQILVFVVLFYYCRHINMSKQAAEDQNSLSSDEEKSDLPFDKMKSGKSTGIEISSKNGTKQVNDSEFSEHNPDNSGNSRNENNSLGLQGLDRDDSKIWVPPNQRVSSCLVPPTSTGKILIPKKTSLKKAPQNVKTSGILFKCKGRNRSSIPRLEKLMKKNVKNNDGPEAKKENDKTFLKIPMKCGKPYVGKDGELLLMNLDDEISPNNMNFACNSEKTSNWETMPHECQSFICISLDDEEISEK